MTTQFPSPMVDHIRAHERLKKKDLPGQSIVLRDVLAKPIEVYRTGQAKSPKETDLLLHFHINALDLKRCPVLKWGPVGMQMPAETQVRGLTILGFAGNTAPDHMDHFYGLPEFLALILGQAGDTSTPPDR